ncbi:MAG: helicase-exonuclease AddAB subunit AddA [Oscillospiraceae bacterium]|nr:helicase-exonuclease AddAB subunit AddA [Oscillospiraceae bacterium]
MREWTEEQSLAINAENGTLLICAAAGSGKTSVLTERIVRKLTDKSNPVSPDSLLVVTFTNAAAAEMRSRIYKRLNEKMSETGNTAFLRSLRARLDEMRVCTMDSFCIRFVRENFSACGVEPDFGIIEQGEENALKAQTAGAVIDGLYDCDSEETRALLRLFEVGRDDGALFDGILALSDFSMSEPDPEEWLNTVADNFISAPALESVWGRILSQHYSRAAHYCISLYETALSELREDGFFREKLESLYCSELNALRDLLNSLEEEKNWNGVAEAIENAKKALSLNKFPTLRGYSDDPLKNSVQAKRNEAKDVLKELSKYYPASEEENAEDICALYPAAKGLVSAVKSFNASLFEAKKQKNLYGFSDIIHFAVSLLYDRSSPDGKTPFARELSDGISEIMIDEYQDTNRVQDRVFSCLSKNGENLFLVGDIKQSIYRFRLASPEIFAEKLEAYPKYDPNHPQKKAKIILSKNFRSRKGVTDAVNFIFSSVMSKDCGEINYNEDERLVYGASYPESSSPDASFFVLDPCGSEPAVVEASFIASLIEEKINSGLTVFENGKERSARYGDFCILMRSLKGVEAYSSALKKKKIPVFFDSRDGFFAAAEIKAAVSFLRAVDNPLRSLDLLASMLSPLGLFTPEHAAKIKNDAADALGEKDIALYSALLFSAGQGDELSAGFLSLLDRFRALSATAQPDEIIETLLSSTSLLPAVLSMEGGKFREANLRALYEASVRFSSDSGKNLSSFIRYIETLTENGAELRKGSVGGDKNSVSILTMHASKGLEFPFVIIAGLTKKINLSDKSPALSVSHRLGLGLKRREPENLKFYETLSSRSVKLSLKNETLSEEMRIYYVALTRAREKLFIVSAVKNAESAIRKIENIIPSQGGIPAFYLGSCVSPILWFLAAFMRHPQASALRSFRSGAVYADFDFEARLMNAPETEEEKNELPKSVSPNEELKNQIRRQISKTYKYAPVSSARSLHTASALKEEKFSDKFFGQSMPAFMFDSSLSPADIGTATHKFLEFCNFSSGEISVPAEIRRLVSLSRLTETEGKSVNIESIETFFASPFFERVKASSEVFREHSFLIQKSIRDFDPAIPEEFSGEKAVVRGQIDLVFIEDGKAVIVDYKTDKINNICVLPERYREQIDIYSEAVEKTLGYEVKERLLYSLYASEFIIC